MAYDWEDDRDRFCDGASRGHVDSPDRDWLEEKLDQAAAQAKSGNLREAANVLEEIRSRVVAVRLFHIWDDGILCFGNLINLIRHLSPEATVPSEYKRLLEAQPSLRWDEDMTGKQKAFWYGSSTEEVGGVVQLVSAGPSPGKSGCLVVLSGLLIGCLGVVTLIMLR